MCVTNWVMGCVSKDIRKSLFTWFERSIWFVFCILRWWCMMNQTNLILDCLWCQGFNIYTLGDGNGISSTDCNILRAAKWLWMKTNNITRDMLFTLHSLYQGLQISVMQELTEYWMSFWNQTLLSSNQRDEASVLRCHTSAWANHMPSTKTCFSHEPPIFAPQ